MFLFLFSIVCFSLLSLVVHLAIKTDTGSFDVLHFLVTTASPRIHTGERSDKGYCDHFLYNPLLTCVGGYFIQKIEVIVNTMSKY